MRFALALSLAGVLSGCGIAAKVDARNEYRNSLADYRECLKANSSAPQACEGKRMVMEADERAFNNMAAGLNPEGNATNNIILQRR